MHEEALSPFYHSQETRPAGVHQRFPTLQNYCTPPWESASSLKQVSREVDPTSSRFLSCAVNRQAPEVGGRAEVVETGSNMRSDSNEDSWGGWWP